MKSSAQMSFRVNNLIKKTSWRVRDHQELNSKKINCNRSIRSLTTSKNRLQINKSKLEREIQLSKDYLLRIMKNKDKWSRLCN